MPDEKIAQKQPTSAGAEPRRAQQAAVDDTVDDSFPASDPPAWTTTGAKSVAGKLETGEAAAEQNDPGQGGGASPVRRIMDQASNLAQETYRRSGEYVEQGRSRFPQVGRYSQQGARVVARPVEQHPL